MFSTGTKIGASLAGTADNCECVPRERIAQELSSKYLLNDETAFIFLKSAKEDHIITDRGYIAVRGQTAGGLKRIVYRADFHAYHLSNVMFETAGVGLTDQDCELKFSIAGQQVSIDIKKSELETGILYYRALTAVAVAQARQAQQLQLFTQLSARTVIQTAETAGPTLSNAIAALDALSPMSYASVLQAYIH